MERSYWRHWHDRYDDPASPLAHRLRVVRSLVRTVLDARTGTTTRVISACAGDGRDILDVTAQHPARESVRALLIELTPSVADAARDTARRHGLAGVHVVEADAGRSDAYASLVPADLLLFCGVFGRLALPDVLRTIGFLPRLAAPAAKVIWTHHRREPAATRAIRARFAAEGFEEEAFVAHPRALCDVAMHRLTAAPKPFRPGAVLFGA